MLEQSGEELVLEVLLIKREEETTDNDYREAGVIEGVAMKSSFKIKAGSCLDFIAWFLPETHTL